MPPGVWTVCHHLNSWGRAEIGQFRKTLDEFRVNIIGLEDAVAIGRIRHLTLADQLHSWCDLTWNHRAKPAAIQLLRRLRLK